MKTRDTLLLAGSIPTPHGELATYKLSYEPEPGDYKMKETRILMATGKMPPRRIIVTTETY